MKLEEAKKIVNKYLEIFRPKCIRIEPAGSYRRERNEIGDIEFVCIPKTVKAADGMFDEKEIRDPDFVSLVNSFPRVKGNGEGKYTKIILEGIKLDLFITTPEQWGVIFMIRTGSDLFSKRMVTEIKDYGFMCQDGYLKRRSGEIVPCYEEKDFFSFTGMEYVEPFARVF
jgi:DNA polymerase/3'-5' exonuclease PolX